jgi:hypothetical protein
MKKPAIILSLLILLGACGASAREKEIKTTLSATTVASEMLPQFSETHQRALVAESTSKEEAVAKTTAFQEKVTHAEKTLNALFDATVAASILDDDQSYATMLRLAEMAWAELKALGVKLP